MDKEIGLFFLTFVSYTFYFNEILIFSDLVLDGSRLNKYTRGLVSVANSIATTLFFTATLFLPLMYTYLVFFMLLSINFIFLYKAKNLNKLFFVLAYLIHFMCLASVIMSVYAFMLNSTLYNIAYSSESMFHTVILIAILGGSAIFIVRRLIPSVEIKIINNHNEQLFFMIIWLSLFNVLMIFNANMFFINVDHPFLKMMQFFLPIAILSGLYIVLFFVIKMGHLLGYKEQSEELQDQIVKSEKIQYELQAKADRDPLTKLYNKEVTKNLIDQSLKSHNNDTISALFLIDIDNFKSVNDQKGHIYGDNVICLLASKLQNIFRSDDVVGRIGGDEFMVFMKNIIDEHTIAIKASEICKAFYLEFDNKDKTLNHVSASVGISLYPLDGRSFSDLYAHADKALYKVKENGKNSFELYRPKVYAFSNDIR